MKNLILAQEQDVGDGHGYIFRTARDDLPVMVTDKKLTDKYNRKSILKAGISVSSGCGVKCIYCFTNSYRHFRRLPSEVIAEQARFVLSLPGNEISNFDEVKISCKQMGDPALNAESTCAAISELFREFPSCTYVVSTSGPRNPYFFRELQKTADRGAKIRLQFSCHTTSDRERKFLSPAIKMMTIGEIAGEVRRWSGTATLNFVMLEEFTYDIDVIRRNFEPSKIFCKINYLDPNSQIKESGLRDMNKEGISVFVKALENEGYDYAFRH